MKPLRIPLIALCVMLLSACALLQDQLKLEQPRIELADIQILEMGVFQQRYALTLNVQNPNARAIPVNGLSYQLDLAGQSFARGVSSKEFTLPAYGETAVEVEMTTNLASTVRQVQGLLGGERETLDYSLSGKLEVPRLGAVPFRNTGEINLTGAGGR